METPSDLRRQGRSPAVLSAFLGGRDNNFNLIRLFAASSVIVSHSFFLVEAEEPGQQRLGYTLGRMAVDIFFVVSGLLVTRSLAQRKSGFEFVCARSLRIFPGLAANLLFVAFVLGPLMANIPFTTYFSQIQPWVYVAKNLQLFALPMPYAVLPDLVFPNGSLWSLPVEVCCYLVLLSSWLIWTAVRGLQRNRGPMIVAAAVLLCLAAYRFSWTAGFHLAWMFSSGAVFYLVRDKLVLSRRMAVLAGAALCASLFERRAFEACVLAAGPYLVMCCAFLPSGWYRGVNKLGDYSYGIYIYGFPAQFVVLRAFPGANVLTHIALALLLAATAGAISWHLVEKPALGKTQSIVAALRRLWAARTLPDVAVVPPGKEGQV